MAADSQVSVAEKIKPFQGLPADSVKFRRSDFKCPMWMAVAVPDEPEELFRGLTGAFVSCESLDEFMDLLEAGRRAEAMELMISPPGTLRRVWNAGDARGAK